MHFENKYLKWMGLGFLRERYVYYTIYYDTTRWINAISNNVENNLITILLR